MLEAEWSDAEVRIVIADDGAGFPSERASRQLGEPFVTTRPVHAGGPDSDDEHVGLGLGFFIAKTLLERSGARLEACNRPRRRRASRDGRLAPGEVRAGPGEGG